MKFETFVSGDIYGLALGREEDGASGFGNPHNVDVEDEAVVEVLTTEACAAFSAFF